MIIGSRESAALFNQVAVQMLKKHGDDKSVHWPDIDSMRDDTKQLTCLDNW